MTCEHCGVARMVMIPMQPGRDKQPWSLCSHCWLEGVRPTKLGNFVEPHELPEIGSPAGRSLAGDQYVYTDKQFDLRTGERTKRPDSPEA
jgi:hypothetical protein